MQDVGNVSLKGGLSINTQWRKREQTGPRWTRYAQRITIYYIIIGRVFIIFASCAMADKQRSSVTYYLRGGRLPFERLATRLIVANAWWRFSKTCQAYRYYLRNIVGGNLIGRRHFSQPRFRWREGEIERMRRVIYLKARGARGEGKRKNFSRQR